MKSKIVEDKWVYDRNYIFYYIIMKIYVLFCTYLFTYLFFIYNYYATTVFLPWILHILLKALKINLPITFTTLFYESFYSYNKLFSWNEHVSKVPNKHLFIY